MGKAGGGRSELSAFLCKHSLHSCIKDYINIPNFELFKLITFSIEAIVVDSKNM